MSERPVCSDSLPGASRAGGTTDPAGNLTLAALIVDVTRDLARVVPPPRCAPYFCLDTEAAYDLRVLDALSERGIFRKYECALEIGCGLGGRARWLAARSSCRVVGVDPDPWAIAAALMLNRRARMDDQVSFQVGHLDHLPLRERAFTHVWILDTHQRRSDTCFAEAYRVLRRGGHFALQSPLLSNASRGQLVDRLCRVGFIELDVCETPLPEIPQMYRIARDRLRAVLRQAPDLLSIRQRIETPPAEDACVQIFARRPA